MQNRTRLIDPEQMKQLDSIETIIAEQYLIEGHWVMKSSENKIKLQNTLSKHY